MPRVQSRSVDDCDDRSSRKIGAALHPLRERGPDLKPRPHKAPEVGVSNFYNDLWPFGGRKAVAVANFCELLPPGHRPYAHRQVFSLVDRERAVALLKHHYGHSITAAEKLPSLQCGNAGNRA
jgi:hypothetical protein